MNISRRDFLKGAAAGAAGLAASSLFGATAFADDAAEKEAEGLFVPEKVEEVFDCDVVIVGGGISGLSAAVQAGECGLKAIVLEKGIATGGAGNGVEGIFAVNTEDQKAQGIAEMDPGEIIRHELAYAQFVPDGVLWTDLVNASVENYEWLKEQGVKYSGVINDYGGSYETMHFFDGGIAGVGYVPPMTEKAKSYGVEFMTETVGKSLIFDGTTVSGIYAQRKDESYIQVNAKAVVIATGGFSYNDEMLKKFGYNLDTVIKIGMPFSDGSGIQMGLSVGAQDCMGDACALVAGAIKGFDSPGNAGMKLTFGGPFLWVNGDGERFTPEDIVNENMMAQYVPAVTQRLCYCVADSAIINGALADTESGLADLEAFIEADEFQVAYKADSLEELAGKFGIDPAALQASVDRYNSMCEKGKDTDFGKDSSLLLPIQEAPFYMYRLDPAPLVLIGGLGTNRNMQVVNDDGEAIPGLYAIGVDGVRLYRNVYPIHVPASCCANNVNSGRRAIRHIAANL